MHDRAYSPRSALPSACTRSRGPQEPPLVSDGERRPASSNTSRFRFDCVCTHHLLACRWRVRGRLNSSGQRLHVRSRASESRALSSIVTLKMTLASATASPSSSTTSTISAASSTVVRRPISLGGTDNADTIRLCRGTVTSSGSTSSGSSSSATSCCPVRGYPNL